MMELGRIAQALSLGEERYRRIEAEMGVDAERYGQHMRQGLTIEGLLEWQVRMDSQQAALRRIRIEIEEATLSWTRTNTLLVEASRERKVLDRILERREATKRAEVARQEQQATDEAASRRYLLR
jgi:flagellar export protein FliJ